MKFPSGRIKLAATPCHQILIKCLHTPAQFITFAMELENRKSTDSSGLHEIFQKPDIIKLLHLSASSSSSALEPTKHSSPTVMSVEGFSTKVEYTEILKKLKVEFFTKYDSAKPSPKIDFQEFEPVIIVGSGSFGTVVSENQGKEAQPFIMGLKLRFRV